MQRKMITVQQICALAALTVIKYRLKGTNMWADILLWKRLDFFTKTLYKEDAVERMCSRLQSKAAERMSLSGGKIYEQICKK